ncbi:hypothetical protein L7F22_026380 [Adiantum nelumboides]|nr:hypothetical protein [Adiantum nelumboides]
MHFVVLPFPTQGHLNPCLMLARLLASQGFIFTFVLTEELASKFEEGGSSEDYSIRHATIRDEAASTISSNGGPFRLVKALEMVDRLRPSFETLLTKLVSSPLGVSCIIFDCFVLWSKQVASKFSILRLPSTPQILTLSQFLATLVISSPEVLTVSGLFQEV